MANSKQSEYELVFIAKEADAATLESVRTGIKEILAKRNAEITKMNELGSKKLFHEKDHHKRGNFNCWNITAPKNMIQTINNDLRVNTNILKSVLVKAGS